MKIDKYNELCRECNSGTLSIITGSCILKDEKLGDIPICNVPLFKCSHCNSTSLTIEAYEEIEKEKKSRTNGFLPKQNMFLP